MNRFLGVATRAVTVLGLLSSLVISAPAAAADDSLVVVTPGAPIGTSAAPAPRVGTPAPRRAGLAAAAVACGYEEFCVSKNTNFGGPTFKFSYASANWSLVSYADLYNEDSSWRSRWTVPVVVYDLTSYGGKQTICVNVNWDVYYAGGANDRGSSHKWDGRSAC